MPTSWLVAGLSVSAPVDPGRLGREKNTDLSGHWRERERDLTMMKEQNGIFKIQFLNNQPMDFYYF